MAEEENIGENEQGDLSVPEMWRLAKPTAPAADDDTTAAKKPAPAAQVGKLVKFLNDIEEQEDFEGKLKEVDPATQQTLLYWATDTGKFVLVEWLIKKAKRAAFAFTDDQKELTIYDKFVEVRKEIEEKEREKALNPPEEAAEGEEEEEKAPEPTAAQQVYEALGDFHEEWGPRGQGIVKRIGELGVYQGFRTPEGVKQGLGRTLFINGDCYTGEYHQNARHGKGTYWFSNAGVIYTGQWRQNLREGLGRSIYPDGGRYYGSWTGDKRNGDGRYTYPNGSSYSGSWVDDVKHGFGSLFFTDGSQYIGTFVDGEFVSGEWRLAGGTRYFGAFVNGTPSGKGVFVFKFGKDGSYRQEGSFEGGKWAPGAVSPADALPEIAFVAQSKTLRVTFTNECGCLGVDALVQAINFGPVRRWLTSIESSKSIFLNSIQVAGVSKDAHQKVLEVRLKVSAVDVTGQRLKGTDGMIFVEPVTQLLVVLISGDQSFALLQQSPNLSTLEASQLRLPTVSVAASGALGGEFVSIVQPALRLTLTKRHTIQLDSALGTVFTGADAGNAEQRALVYIQHVHQDVFTTLQATLDAATQNNTFLKVRAVHLGEVASLSSDAFTILTAHSTTTLLASKTLPDATIETQRPPTPIPPAPEPRPNIEPLLEAERLKNQDAKRKQEEPDDA